MKWLEELLKEYVEVEKIGEIVEKFNKENPKYFMPKDKFNEVNDELKITKTQLEENKNLMDDLSKKANSLEEYEQKLSDWQQKYNQLEEGSQKEISQITKRNQLKDILLENDFHKDGVKLIIKTADYDSINLEDGKIKDVESLLSKFKEEYSGLMIQTNANSKDKGEQTDNPNVVDQHTKDFRSALGLE